MHLNITMNSPIGRKTEGGGGYDEFGYREKLVEVNTYDGKQFVQEHILCHISLF